MRQWQAAVRHDAVRAISGRQAPKRPSLIIELEDGIDAYTKIVFQIEEFREQRQNQAHANQKHGETGRARIFDPGDRHLATAESLTPRGENPRQHDCYAQKQESRRGAEFDSALNQLTG